MEHYKAGISPALLRGSYTLTRVVFLRFLGCLYAVAFKIALDQNGALIGDEGLTPVAPFLGRLIEGSCRGDRWACFQAHPTVFWFTGGSGSSLELSAVAGSGLVPVAGA